MPEVLLNDKDLEERFINIQKFYINYDDLKYISCDGKECDPATCLHTSCKVHEYWRNKDD